MIGARRPGVWLIVGLGNPGPRYAGNRHNIGYRVVEELAERDGGRWRRHRSGRADVCERRLGAPGIDADRLWLIRPRSYMNESGGPVAAVRRSQPVSQDRLVVVHDELDLDFGRIRVKLGGGDNGHNGLRSLRASLGGGEFYRVRCGIGRPSGRQDVSDYVLSDYSASERRELPLQVGAAADAVESLVLDGLTITQQRFHSLR